MNNPGQKELDYILKDDPTLCFCKIPAYKSFTVEHGPILECGKFDIGPLTYYETLEESRHKELNDIEKKMTCGFHIHEISWNLLRRDLKNGKTISSEFNELKACSLYNLTYCTSFYLENDLIKENLDNSPICYCGRPAALRLFSVRFDGEGVRRVLRFTCQESINPNASRKCNWRILFKEAALSRPMTPSHTVIDVFTYHDLVSQKYSQHHHTTVESQHRMDLLATLTTTSSNLSTFSTAGAALDERDINQYHNSPLLATHGHSFLTTNIQSSSTNHAYNNPVVSYDLDTEDQNRLCKLCLGSGIISAGDPCQHCGIPI